MSQRQAVELTLRYYIGKEEVDILARAEQLQRSRRRLSGYDAVSELFEEHARHFLHIRVVLDQRFCSPGRGLSLQCSRTGG
jgi:hypothetical protein